MQQQLDETLQISTVTTTTPISTTFETPKKKRGRPKKDPSLPTKRKTKKETNAKDNSGTPTESINNVSADVKWFVVDQPSPSEFPNSLWNFGSPKNLISSETSKIRQNEGSELVNQHSSEERKLSSKKVNRRHPTDNQNFASTRQQFCQIPEEKFATTHLFHSPQNEVNFNQEFQGSHSIYSLDHLPALIPISDKAEKSWNLKQDFSKQDLHSNINFQNNINIQNNINSQNNINVQNGLNFKSKREPLGQLDPNQKLESIRRNEKEIPPDCKCVPDTFSK